MIYYSALQDQVMSRLIEGLHTRMHEMAGGDFFVNPPPAPTPKAGDLVTGKCRQCGAYFVIGTRVSDLTVMPVGLCEECRPKEAESLVEDVQIAQKYTVRFLEDAPEIMMSKEECRPKEVIPVVLDETMPDDLIVMVQKKTRRLR